MEEMKILNYANQDVRMILIDGLPWWVLADVCRVLEIASSWNVSARLDDDEKMTICLTEGHSGKRGGARKNTVVNESGLYSVILRSDKPEAKAFKRWITHEVLPSIRQTGSYEIAPSADEGVEPSVEAGLQRIGLIIRAAEHKAVPQSEQLRLLSIAVCALTGTELNLSPTPVSVARGIMELPEVFGAAKKGKVKNLGGGGKVRLYSLLEIADALNITPAEFNAFADEHGLKGNYNGEWTRVKTPQGEAREFLYIQSVMDEYREETKE